MTRPDPATTLAEVRDLSGRIDRLHGDVPLPDNVIAIDFAAGTVRFPTGPDGRWKGRRSAEPLTYDQAISIQLLQRERAQTQHRLPPLAVVA